jgi:hypothetical protein
VDELLHGDSFTDTRTSEESDFSSFDKRTEEIDDLDTGFKNFNRIILFCDVGRSCMDTSALYFFVKIHSIIDRVPEDIEDSSENRFSNWCLDRMTTIVDCFTTSETISRCHGDSSDETITEMALDFKNDCFCSTSLVYGGGECRIFFWYRVCEIYIDDDA